MKTTKKKARTTAAHIRARLPVNRDRYARPLRVARGKIRNPGGLTTFSPPKPDPELVAKIRFDPAMMPARDSDGWACHPDVDLLYRAPYPGERIDHLLDDEGHVFDRDLLHAAGFLAEWRALEADHDAPPELLAEYFDLGLPDGIAAWNPVLDGAELVALYDTEDSGPVAMFVRRDYFREIRS